MRTETYLVLLLLLCSATQVSAGSTHGSTPASQTTFHGFLVGVSFIGAVLGVTFCTVLYCLVCGTDAAFDVNQAAASERLIRDALLNTAISDLPTYTSATATTTNSSTEESNSAHSPSGSNTQSLPKSNPTPTPVFSSIYADPHTQSSGHYPGFIPASAVQTRSRSRSVSFSASYTLSSTSFSDYTSAFSHSLSYSDSSFHRRYSDSDDISLSRASNDLKRLHPDHRLQYSRALDAHSSISSHRRRPRRNSDVTDKNVHRGARRGRSNSWSQSRDRRHMGAVPWMARTSPASGARARERSQSNASSLFDAKSVRQSMNSDLSAYYDGPGSPCEVVEEFSGTGPVEFPSFFTRPAVERPPERSNRFVYEKRPDYIIDIATTRA